LYNGNTFGSIIIAIYCWNRVYKSNVGYELWCEYSYNTEYGLVFQDDIIIKLGVLNYFLISFYTIPFIKKNGFSSLIRLFKEKKKIILLFFLMAVADVEANFFGIFDSLRFFFVTFLVVKSYQYTTITSVMLLDCFSIPCVMLLSRFFLKSKYSIRQIASVGICLLGIGALVLSDYLYNPRESGKIFSDLH
jgi:hypothetical protein